MPRNDALAPIFAVRVANLPAPRPMRHASQKERTAAIRWLLVSTLHMSGVRVVMARGAGCTQTDVFVPRLICDMPEREWSSASGAYVHDRRACPTCSRNAAARRRVEYAIATVFPDLDNRSDSQTDHFDFVVSVH